ncbi:hypothetical protein Acr_01g0000190 [Actinidia rufa]|uniref:Uncharacterized protein n=1 Tax=Actinidia rufa TaxID=165716 RepID=A0A7J0E1D2_9ERIC|nr:hypothetical protein Acr_01g0000190 [Actinidia rufa]
MAKKRKSDTRLDEVDRSMYNSFCTAANSLSQLYTHSMNQQQFSFHAGERPFIDGGWRTVQGDYGEMPRWLSMEGDPVDVGAKLGECRIKVVVRDAGPSMSISSTSMSGDDGSAAGPFSSWGWGGNPSTSAPGLSTR